VPLEPGDAPDAAWMQSIAAEMRHSETAYIEPRADGSFGLRWFTPEVEVDLCGHATLASAHVVFEHLEPAREQATFHSASGPLHATRDRGTGRIALDFPAYESQPGETTPELVAALRGAQPVETWTGRRLMAVFESEAAVRALKPDFGLVAKLPGFGLIVTAPGDTSDFASRYFVPQAGVNEDPVTGAAHCQLAPWWAARLGRGALHARQVSRRGGELWVEHLPPRVRLWGHAVEYLAGTLRWTRA